MDLNRVTQNLAQLDADSIPPLEQWNPSFCGDIDLEIKQDGRWFYMGSEIKRERMVKLFSRVLWLENERFYLKTPVEKIGIRVEDAPFQATTVSHEEVGGQQRLEFTLLTGEKIIAGSENRIEVISNGEQAEPRPYLHVRFGMKALIGRTAFYQLVEMATVEDIDKTQSLWIESLGTRFLLGEVDLSLGD